MSYTYRVMVQAPGSLDMVDCSQWYQDVGSNLATAARDKATEAKAVFWFEVGEVGTPDIREGAELWAGWWDAGAGQWLGTAPIYGGFIMQIESSGPGSRHIIDATISSYQVLLTRASVIGWPTGENATGIPTGGVGAGYSVADWLASLGGLTGGASGVVRTYLPGCDYSGIDASFDSRIFTAQTRPGNPDPQYPFIGSWAFTTVAKVLDDIAGAVRTVWPDVEPVYWLGAVASGAIVQPKFYFHDNADTSGAVVATFSTDPVAGEFYIA